MIAERELTFLSKVKLAEESSFNTCPNPPVFLTLAWIESPSKETSTGAASPLLSFARGLYVGGSLAFFGVAFVGVGFVGVALGLALALGFGSGVTSLAFCAWLVLLVLTG